MTSKRLVQNGLFALFFTLALQTVVVPEAFADQTPTLRYLSAETYAAVKSTIPNFPAAGSAEEQSDISAIQYFQQTRTPAECERANTEVTISLASFFGAPYGELSSEQVQMLSPLFNQVHSDLNYFVAQLKTDFARKRPYDYIPGVKPCIPKDPSYAYPSGHTTTATLEALVLGQIYPQLASLLNNRALQIGEDRVMGGVHHPTDIQAGHLLAKELFAAMQASPAYQNDIRALKAQAAQQTQAQPEQN